MQYTGYDRIAAVDTFVPPATDNVKRPPLTPDELAQRDAKRAELWQHAKPEAMRVMQAQRPDLAPLVELMQPTRQSTPAVLIVAHGDLTEPPHVLMQFAVDASKDAIEPRLVRLHIFAGPTKDLTKGRVRRQWRIYAEKTIEQLWGRQPIGQLNIESVTRGHYLHWQPRWKHRPLPRQYWTTFSVLQHADYWLLDWSRARQPAAIDQARSRLDRYPVRHDLMHAVMVVVKNAEHGLPHLIDDDAKVWADMVSAMPDDWGRSGPTVESTSMGKQPLKLLHANPEALARQAQRGAPVLNWQVRITPQRRRTVQIMGWVCPADGELLRLGINRPP